ncbi:MAG: fluoride efflux transporter CrcB [Marivirga sp.]|nr:fluoride efflux transporter CrcB [Marivirga sp.]
MPMDVYKVLAVGFGGFLGSVARYVTVKSIDEKLNAVFPYGTLTVNVIGSFLLGLIYTWITRKPGMTDTWRLFLGAGFCGGFTTFSAFALENFNLIQQKLVGTSLAYVSVSLLAGLLALAVGVWIGRFL